LGLHFDWGNGATTITTVEELLPGSYTVIAADSAGCIEQQNFFIGAIGLVTVTLGMDTVWAEDGETLLQSYTSPLDSSATFQWTPAWGLEDPTSASTLCKVTDTTTYVITVISAAGCSASDTVVVVPVPLVQPMVPTPCGEAFLPDIFSPNGDGLNDALCLLGGCFTTVELHIYDSWGQRVFLGGVNNACWDGTYNGSHLPAGSYAYTLAAERITGDVLEQAGTITLRR
jgi:gliding motility-associated-like protein